MQKKAALFCMTALTLGMLFSCKGTEGSYFTISVYGDYEGMEADLQTKGRFDTSKATKIGVCYAVKNQKANLGGMQTYKDAEGKAYNFRKSFRSSENGYEYKFKEFAGYYDSGDPIDLTHITADCAVFTTFDLAKKTYLVMVEDAYGATYNGESEYRAYSTSVGEIETLRETLLAFPKHDPLEDTLEEGYSRDAYYIDYQPLGWDVYEYDDDDKVIPADGEGLKNANGDPITAFLPYDDEDAITAYTIRHKTKFKAHFDESKMKQYRIDFSYQLRELDHYEASGKAVYRYSDFGFAGSLPSFKTVTYGTGVDIKAEEFQVPDYVSLGIGGDGGTDRYDIADESLPSILIENYLNGEEVVRRGVPVSLDNIRYNCHVTVIYERSVTYQVTFHNDLANPDATVVEQPKENAPVIDPDVLNVPDNQSFVNEWTKTPGSMEVYDLSHINEDVELYPIVLDRAVTAPNGMEYTLELGFHGYTLTDVPATFTQISAGDVNPVLPERYPLVGVDSFGAATNELRSIELPAEIGFLSHGVIASARKCASVDLSKTTITSLHPRAFQNMPALILVKLPSTLQSVGEDLFRGCTSSPSIQIDLTAAEVAERDFASNWSSGLTVIYKE